MHSTHNILLKIRNYPTSDIKNSYLYTYSYVKFYNSVLWPTSQEKGPLDICKIKIGLSILGNYSIKLHHLTTIFYTKQEKTLIALEVHGIIKCILRPVSIGLTKKFLTDAVPGLR